MGPKTLTTIWGTYMKLVIKQDVARYVVLRIPPLISCLLRDLEFFIFAAMKTFVTDISASTGRNDSPVYRVTEFFMFLQHFLIMSVEIYTNLKQMNEWGYWQT
jgi:hypothetical protein